MIKDITELNFPSYATLNKATVSLNDMGERTITTEVAIDGQIRPDFSYDWEVEFKNEKYIMPLRKPQGVKDDSSRNSKINLTFQHWAQYQLKRWYFFTLASENAGVAVPDKYIASVSLNLENFVNLFNKVLEYYYGDKIKLDLNPDWQFNQEPVFVDINYSYMWDVLIKLYELYAVRWEIVRNPDYESNEYYLIKVGYDAQELDHIFEYGFQGGLLKVERQVQDDNIRNMIMGRGGEKNLPYRYFKNVDPDNPDFPADPDWVHELANFYFDRLRSAEFRSYVQGWKYAHRNEYLIYNESGNGVIGVNNSRFVPVEDTTVPWAWEKGYTDTTFNPIEYVKDDDSIRKYGELMGKLEDNEEIYPSIQGVDIQGIGRIDEAVDVEQVTNDAPDITDAIGSNGTFIESNETGEVRQDSFFKFTKQEVKTLTLALGSITVKNGTYVNADKIGDVDISVKVADSAGEVVYPDYHDFFVINKTELVAVDLNGEERPANAIPRGTYTLLLKVELKCVYDDRYNTNAYAKLICKGARIDIYTIEYDPNSKDSRTFDIWIKNIWETEPKDGEDPIAYSHRVWDDILGNHLGEDAAVCFSTGWLSTSEDYEFRLVNGCFPVYDTSRSLNGVYSHWRLTLERSNADYNSLGKYVPNLERQGKAGDKFYFIGINLTQYYVEWNEKRLYDYKMDQLGKVKEITPSWSVKLDKVRIGQPKYDDTVAILDQLHIGNSIRLADKRFIDSSDGTNLNGQTYITLYLQSLTYKYNDGNTANITPSVEITLGNEYVTSANAVATIQGQIDSISQQLGATSVSNIQQIVRMVGDKIYLRKDGLTDRSLSKTYFAELLASLGFTQGIVGGRGWGFFQDENGKWVLETDRINVRDEMQVNNLVINQIQARGGMIIESAASIEVTYVESVRDGYKCYFDIKSGSVGNLFIVDDIAYCHRWTPENEDLKIYKRRITEVGDDYILLANTDAYGSGIPAVGDVIVQYGNVSPNHKDRQFVIIRDVINGGYERMLSGLDSVNTNGTEYFFAGYQSSTGERLFIGNKTNYLLYEQGKLTISGIFQVTTDKGNMPIEDFIKSFIPDLNLDDWEYLRKALNDGETTTMGGLILTNLIQLGTGKVSDRTFKVYSGINGQPTDEHDKGYGIASWYGGEMLDIQYPPQAPLLDNARFAKSLFRFDGSGYLAGGNIYWDTAGSGGLAGGNITFESDGTLTLHSSGISIAGGGENAKTLESLVNTLNTFTTFFKPVIDKTGKTINWSEIKGGTNVYAIKSTVGFFSDSFISAMGLNSTNGSAGVEYLSQLEDVDLTNLASGQALVWNGSKWENRTISGGGSVDIVQTITRDTDKVPSAYAVSEALSNLNENYIQYSQLKTFLANNYSTLRTIASPHIYQIYYGLYNIGMVLITSDNSLTTLSLLLFTKMQVSGNQITSQMSNDSPKLYRATYTYTTGYMSDWEDIGTNDNADQINTNKEWINALRDWTEIPSKYIGEWNDGTLYSQMKRLIIPVDGFFFGSVIDYGTIRVSAGDEDNRYITRINLSDNRIYLTDAYTGRNYSRWNNYELWKPSDAEYYKEGHIYVCYREAQIISYDQFWGGLRVTAGSLFMKGLFHEEPMQTDLSQLSIPYMDETYTNTDAKVMSLKALKNLIGSNQQNNITGGLSTAKTNALNNIELLDKPIAVYSGDTRLGYAKVLTTSSLTTLTLETMYNLTANGMWGTPANPLLNTYFTTYKNGAWSDWKLINQIKLE